MAEITEASTLNLSGAIREALNKLGIDAPAKDVAAAVTEKFPPLADRIKGIGDKWDNYVSGQRKRLKMLAAEHETTTSIPAKGLRYSPPFVVQSPPVETVTIANILDLGKIKAMLKNPDDLAEIIKLFAGLGSPQKLEMILKKHDELMAKHGDETKVAEFLTTIQELGLTV